MRNSQKCNEKFRILGVRIQHNNEKWNVRQGKAALEKGTRLPHPMKNTRPKVERVSLRITACVLMRFLNMPDVFGVLPDGPIGGERPSGGDILQALAAEG